MSDETNADVLEQETASETEAPKQVENEAEAVETDQAEGEEVETEASEGDEESESAPEFEEIEWEDGKRHKVPKELKDAFMKNADYTTKTQELAKQRRALEEQAKRVEQVTEEELQMRGQLAGVQAELQRYQQVDWETLEQTDRESAQSHWRRYQQLKDAAQTVSGQLEQKATERTEAAKQETANRLQETRAFAEQNIPGWSPEVDAKVTDFLLEQGRSQGITRDTLVEAYNPFTYQLAHLAWLGYQAMSKKPTAQKPKAASEPLKQVKAKSSTPPSGLDDRLSAEEWVKRRNKQVRGR